MGGQSGRNRVTKLVATLTRRWLSTAVTALRTLKIGMFSNGFQSIGFMTAAMGLTSYAVGLVPLSVTLSSAWHDHQNLLPISSPDS